MEETLPISRDLAVVSEGIVKNYGKVVALQDVDIHVPKGSM